MKKNADCKIGSEFQNLKKKKKCHIRIGSVGIGLGLSYSGRSWAYTKRVRDVPKRKRYKSNRVSFGSLSCLYERVCHSQFVERQWPTTCLKVCLHPLQTLFPLLNIKSRTRNRNGNQSSLLLAATLLLLPLLKLHSQF